MSFNELVVKIGIDKMLHFFVGGFVTALFTIVSLLQENYIGITTVLTPFIGLVPVAMFSWFKEMVIDDKFVWKDIIASVLGGVPVFIAVALGVLFNILSN